MQAASPQCMHAMETYWTGVGESSLFNSTTCLNRGPRAPGSSCTLGRLLWADLHATSQAKHCAHRPTLKWNAYCMATSPPFYR